MGLMRFACLASLVFLTAVFPADAQGVRTSTWEPETALLFQGNIGPLPRVDTAEACRDSCVNDERCAGWNYAPRPAKQRGLCFIGFGIKDRQPAAAGETSGEIR